MKQDRINYALPDGRVLSFEQVKAMSDEEFWATIPHEAQNFFTKQPELLKSFRLQAEGEHDASREAVKEAVQKILGPKDGAFIISGSSLEELHKQLKSQLESGLPKEVFDEISAKLPHIFKEARRNKREQKEEFVPMSPAEQAEVDRLAEMGFNLFLSKDNFETLITVMSDAHQMYSQLLEKKEELQKLTPGDTEIKDSLSRTEERHHNWHTLHEEMHAQFVKLYPGLAEDADDHTKGETFH